MSTVVVVGAQWGDEGKGKVVDALTERADVVVRFSGGANAGHTLVVGDDKIVTHLIPSGVLHPGKRCILADGMVIDASVLVGELDTFRARGLLGGDRAVLVGRRAHVVMPYHRELDVRREAAAGKDGIGTTKRGIGPAYESKVGRRGIRIGDLVRPDRLRDLVARNAVELDPLLVALGGDRVDVPTVIAQALAHGERLAPFLGDAGRAIREAVRAGQNVLLEGAQGTLLDIDHGTYPYVTSTSVAAGGACTGAGIGPTCIDSVLGISKAYATRVGGGPFPTELAGAAAERLRQEGDEFGATTGRPRRTGWLDLPALRYAVRVNGMTGLALTKLDVLTGWSEIKLCVAYRLCGEMHDEIPLDPEDVLAAEPVYETMSGWTETLRGARTLTELPAAARRYVERIGELAEVPVSLVSVGPGRGETIQISPPF